jgi:hypothetical protein
VIVVNWEYEAGAFSNWGAYLGAAHNTIMIGNSTAKVIKDLRLNTLYVQCIGN